MILLFTLHQLFLVGEMCHRPVKERDVMREGLLVASEMKLLSDTGASDIGASDMGAFGH